MTLDALWKWFNGEQGTYITIVLLVLMGYKIFFNLDPRKIVSDHVNYIHATLGMGKTALAAYYVYKVLHPYSLFHKFLSFVFRKPLRPVPAVYATFELDNTTPLMLGSSWPMTRGAKIVIDELLLLDANDLITLEWFAKGCTLARQLGQQVIIISQASRLPRRLDKFKGTVGLFITMKGISFGDRGRVIFVKRASEPFIRRSKGYRADGQKWAVLWLPGWVFETYNSRKIYGYTVDSAGAWIDLDTARNAEGVGRQGDRQAAAAPRAALGGDSRPAGQAVGQRPPWHRPGGKFGSRSVRRRV